MPISILKMSQVLFKLKVPSASLVVGEYFEKIEDSRIRFFLLSGVIFVDDEEIPSCLCFMACVFPTL